jgi:hypothetical protein
MGTLHSHIGMLCHLAWEHQILKWEHSIAYKDVQGHFWELMIWFQAMI